MASHIIINEKNINQNIAAIIQWVPQISES